MYVYIYVYIYIYMYVYIYHICIVGGIRILYTLSFEPRVTHRPRGLPGLQH